MEFWCRKKARKPDTSGFPLPSVAAVLGVYNTLCHWPLLFTCSTAMVSLEVAD